MVSGDGHAKTLRIAPILVGIGTIVACALVSDGRTGGVRQDAPTLPRRSDCQVFVANAADSRAIAGALVELEQLGVRRWTDAEGMASFPDVTGDTLRVSAFGFARRRVPVDADTLRSDSTLRLDLEPGLRMQGVIVDEHGVAVRGASIEAAFDDDPSEPPIAGRVADSGSWVIDFLRPGRWVVTARAPLHESSSRILIASSATEAPPERFVLAPTGALEVHVADATGNHVVGADVEVGGVGFSEPRRATTDDVGLARFVDLPRGVYEARGSHAGLSSRRVTGLNVETGVTAHANVVLESSHPMRGRVVDADGTAIAGVEVTLTEDALDLLPRLATSDAEGAFVFGAVPDHPHVLVARLEGFVPFGPVIVTPTEELPTITLLRSGTIRGRVFDSNGEPVIGAIVTLIDERGEVHAAGGTAAAPAPALPLAPVNAAESPMLQAAGELGVTLGDIPPIPLGAIAATPTASSLSPSVASFTIGSVTDRSGSFVLVGVPPGTVQLAAHHPAHPSLTSAPRHLRSGETIDGWDLTFPAAGTLNVRVVDARNRPLGGVPVELRTDADDVPRTQTTDYDGRITFEGVSGILVVTAMPLGRAAGRARAEVRAGARVDVEIALEEARFALDGRVVDMRGAPLEGARVEVSSTRARAMLEAFVLTEADGTFHFDALPAPPYRITADHSSYAPTRLDDVRPREGRIEIRLQTGGTIAGVLVDEDGGRPVERAIVSLMSGDSLVDEDASDGVGRFRFERIPTGRYSLKIRPRDHMAAERAVTLAPSRFDAPSLDLGEIELVGAFVIRGVVTDSLGDPVPRARVTLPFTLGSPTASTDVRGGFELRGVAPGTYELVAEHVRAGTARARRAVRGAAHELVSDVEVRLPGRLQVDDRSVDPAIVRGVAAVLDTEGPNVVVVWVAPASAAEEGLLRVGDRIRSVDAEPVLDRTRAEELLRGPTGVVAEIVVGRGGGERRLRITRELYRPPPDDVLRLR